MKVGREIWDDPKARRKWVEEFAWDMEKLIAMEYDDLPEGIKLLLRSRPRKGVLVTEKTVSERIWAPGDTYLIVPEIQVMSISGFNEGDRVKVTVEKLKVNK